MHALQESTTHGKPTTQMDYFWKYLIKHGEDDNNPLIDKGTMQNTWSVIKPSEANTTFSELSKILVLPYLCIVMSVFCGENAII